MKKAVLILLAAGMFVAVIVAKAPAWLLLDTIRGQVPGLALGPASGTVWQGDIDSVRFQQLSVGGVAWHLRPWALFGHAPLAISTQTPVRASALLGVTGEQQLVLTDSSVEGEIGPLLAAAGLPSMGFEGQFSLKLSSATLAAQGCNSLDGQLRIAGLRGDIAGIDSLGAIVAALSCRGGAVRLSIDENNPNRVRGSLTVSGDGRTRGQITLSPPPGSELFLSLRDFLGQPRNGKDFVIRL